MVKEDLEKEAAEKALKSLSIAIALTESYEGVIEAIEDDDEEAYKKKIEEFQRVMEKVDRANVVGLAVVSKALDEFIAEGEKMAREALSDGDSDDYDEVVRGLTKMKDVRDKINEKIVEYLS